MSKYIIGLSCQRSMNYHLLLFSFFNLDSPSFAEVGTGEGSSDRERCNCSVASMDIPSSVHKSMVEI